MQRLLLVLCLFAAGFAASAQLSISNPRCEYRTEPMGIDTLQPHLSWTLESTNLAARGLRQSAYQILVATERDRLQVDQADLWDSGKVESDQMAQVPYAGKTLASHRHYWWAVRVWDQDGQPSGWSKPASWTMGLLDPRDWKAKWISAADAVETSGPLPLFRHEFTVEPLATPEPGGPRRILKRAVVYVCGLGFYELFIDGRKVGNQVLDPGWTNYRKRCLYATHDVTRHLQDASGRRNHSIGVMLGNGMYNVRGGRYAKFTGSFGPPQVILQLRIEFSDGTFTNIVTDRSWKTAPGPITFSCIYGGEDYDARRELRGWDGPGFDDATWQASNETDGPGGRLVSQSAPVILVTDTIDPVKVTEPRSGVFVYDLGRNFSGWPELTVRGPAGSSVKLVPGELLDEHGLVSQVSSGGPVSFSYTLQGSAGRPSSLLPDATLAREGETWHPRFSYSGFRYVQMEGAVPTGSRATGATGPVVLALRGQFLHSAAHNTGRFASSEVLLGNIHRLILAAIESNLQSVLTDCPHREKLGWLEVSHLLGPAIMFDYDVPQLYRKICDDMADAQLDNGLVPDIAPEFVVFSGGFRDSPEWGSACVINPWLLYQRFGDREVLGKHYGLMASYADYLGSRAAGHIVSHGLGDWYDIGTNPPGESQLTSKGLTATAIYFQDLEILRQTAELLGKAEDAKKWAALGLEVSRAFNAKFFNPAKAEYDRGSQTANAMALALGLAGREASPGVLENLVRDVRARGNQVTAGDVGFRFLTEALRLGGRSDVLFDLVTRLQGPGYADQLRKGATTLTEAWDANPASSQNHCMLGHAEEWFYTSLAGINPDPTAPGFRKILFRPQVASRTLWVQASYDSISGRIRSAWKKANGEITLDISIPPNTAAKVFIPSADSAKVTESGKPLEQAPGIRFLGVEGTTTVCEIGSGHFLFLAPWTEPIGHP